MTANETEAVDPSQYDPDAQGGVSYAKPKDLDAGGEDHPMYQRVVERGVDDEEGFSVEEGATIPWNVPPTVLKHVSDGLYQSEEATIREFIANSETACLRTQHGEARVVPDDYQPIVEVTYKRDRNMLVVQDNGIGIASATAIDVLREIGVTTTRDTGSQSGQFGMGLASFLKLIGPQNSMIMKTRSRITDENYAAYVNLGGFDPIRGGMPEGVYGTRFEMVPKGDIDHSDIRQYVETYSKWLRVPVHYEEYDESGKQCYDEDWQGKSFTDDYGDDKMWVKFSKPGLLTATTSPDAQGRTLLVSMEIERNDGSSTGTDSYEAPYKFDVRIEDESGAIVECNCPDADHEGLTPVADSEYAIMDAKQRESHIAASDVGPNDLTLPEPTTSRDTLQEHPEFWKWLSRKLMDRFEEECGSTYKGFGSIEEVLKVRGRELLLAVEGIERLNYGHGRSLQQAVEDAYGVSIDGDVADALKLLGRGIGVCERGENPESKSNVDWNASVADVLQASDPDGEVFMGISMNEKKAKVAWDLNENNVVVQVENDDQYDEYQNLFGWRKLEEITLTKLHEYDISDSVYSELVGHLDTDDVDDDMKETVERAPPTPADEEELNVTMAKSTLGQSTFESSRIREVLKRGDTLHVCNQKDKRAGLKQRSSSVPEGTDVNKLILFPTNSDHNISDNYSLFDNYGDVQVAGANCNVRTYNYLKDLDGVMRIEDYIENAWKTPIETNKGLTTLGEAQDNMVVHIVDEDVYTYFHDRQDELTQYIADYWESDLIPGSTGGDWKKAWPDADDMHYAVLSHDDLWRYRPALKEAAGDSIVLFHSSSKPDGFSKWDCHNLAGAGYLYLYARFPEWDIEEPVVQELLDKYSTRLSDGYEVIETVAKVHDDGGSPVG